MAYVFNPITGNLDFSVPATPSSIPVGIPLTGSTNYSILSVDGSGTLSQLGPLTNGQLLIGSTGGSAVAALLTGTTNQITVTPGSGTITLSLPQNIATTSSPTFNDLTVSSLTGNIITGTGLASAINQLDDSVNQLDQTGHNAWTSSAPYWSITGGNTFNLLASGNGYIHGKKVSWTQPQSISIPANTCQMVVIDNTGTIQIKAAPASDVDYHDNIPLFLVTNDGTNIIVVIEDHDYSFNTDVVDFLHNNLGTVIQDGGANCTRITTGTGTVATDRELMIVGNDYVNDAELRTVIPDSGGSAISWLFYRTNGSGHWTRYLNQVQFPMVYNNAGTVTALPTGSGHFGVFSLFVTKSSGNTSTPQYIAVLDNTNYTTLGNANTAITNGTIAIPTNELVQLQIAQLGYVIVQNNVSGGFINTVIVAKSGFFSKLIGSGNVGSAALTTVNTSSFVNFFTAADNNVQNALNTLDANILTTATANSIAYRDGSGNLTATNLSGTNTGDITLSAFGSTPNANGASLSGQALTLQPSDTTHPGGLSLSAQTLVGLKTFNDGLDVADTQYYKYNTKNVIFAETSSHNYFFANSGVAGSGGLSLHGFGDQALASLSGGNNNNAFGRASLNHTTTGDSNSAFGHLSLQANTTGFQNTAIGSSAGYAGNTALQTNSNSTFIGYNTSSSIDGISNSTALGANAQVTTSNQMVFGDTNVTANVMHGSLTVGSLTPTTQLDIAYGGTGQTTQQAAINALTGTQTSGYYLRSNGTNATLSAIQAGDVPTLNQNTTGTASNVTGVVAIANGGTSLSTTPTDGQLLIGKTSTNAYVQTTLSQGTGITVTNGSGIITISNPNVSSNDIIETTFTDSTDIRTNQTVTGLAFNTSNVRSFVAWVSVCITGSNLFSEFSLRGIQRASDWVLTYDRGGDDTGVTFSITNAGQVQFSKTTTASFTSTKMVFRAITTKVF